MRGPRFIRVNFSRRLRKAQTDTEAELWRHLRNRQLAGYKFVRQEPMGRYVYDFVCRERRLIVEVDGGQHGESAAHLPRDEWLRARRYRVLRFSNNDVLSNVEGVLLTIEAALSEVPPHPA